MDISEKLFRTELLVKVLTVILDLNDDPLYTKELAVNDLLNVVRYLENEQLVLTGGDINDQIRF